MRLCWLENYHIRNRGIVEIKICLGLYTTHSLNTHASFSHLAKHPNAVLSCVRRSITPDTLAYSWSLPQSLSSSNSWRNQRHSWPFFFFTQSFSFSRCAFLDLLASACRDRILLSLDLTWAYFSERCKSEKVPEIVPLQANLQQEAEGKWREESSGQRLLMSDSRNHLKLERTLAWISASSLFYGYFSQSLFSHLGNWK